MATRRKSTKKKTTKATPRPKFVPPQDAPAIAPAPWQVAEAPEPKPVEVKPDPKPEPVTAPQVVPLRSILLGSPGATRLFGTTYGRGDLVSSYMDDKGNGMVLSYDPELSAVVARCGGEYVLIPWSNVITATVAN